MRIKLLAFLFIVLFSCNNSVSQNINPNQSISRAISSVIQPNAGTQQDNKIDFWQKAAWLGNLLSGISLFVAAGVACYTLHFINKRNSDQDWINGYHQLYAEFWNNENLSTVRKWISSDSEYTVLKSILDKDTAASENQISSSENDILENVDRFCAILVRMKSYGKLKSSNSQKSLWSLLYGDYWMNKFRSRPELKNYADKYWQGMFD